MLRLVRLGLIFACAGCSASGPAPTASGALPPAAPRSLVPSGAIQHVVIVVQENRSFNNLFSGFPGAATASFAQTHTGDTIALAQVNLEEGIDIAHYRGAFLQAYDGGKMDGFDLQPVNAPAAPPTYPYAYVNRAQVQPYWDLARSYTLADRMFSTQGSGSFTAHQDLIAGGAPSGDGQLIDFPSAAPWGCDAPAGTVTHILHPDGSVTEGPFPCLAYPTMATNLDAANVSWKYYAPSVVGPDIGGKVWSPFDAIRAVRYGPDWEKNVSSPETNVLADIDAGRLPQVSWVIPDLANSDHPISASNSGPSWVASIVNKVGSSPYWSSTAIVIVWDEWGGWYDNLPPPQLDYAGLGIRVPMIVVSPYARHGFVSHTQYEFGSILRFVEEAFNLPSLNTTDARSASILDCFDFTQRPTPLAKVRSAMSESAIRARPHSYLAPDTE